MSGGKRSSNGLVAAGVGIAFVGYVFNAAGLQTRLDGLFQTLNQRAHQHEAAIGSTFLAALPFLGVLALLFLGFMAHVYLRGVGPGRSSGKKGHRKGVKQVAEQIRPVASERVLLRPRAYPGSDAGVAILVDTGKR